MISAAYQWEPQELFGFVFGLATGAWLAWLRWGANVEREP